MFSTSGVRSAHRDSTRSGRAGAIALALIVAAGVAAQAAQASSQSARASSHAVSAAYAEQCRGQSKKHLAGSARSRFSKCIAAMTRLARAETRSPTTACGSLPRTRTAGTRISSYSRCVTAGTALIRNGNGIDRAFVDEMILHHVAAVDMAKLALTQGQSDFLRNLAASIISSQTEEIATLRRLSATLRQSGMKAVTMGLTKAEKGMGHDVSHLAGANPFDVHFIDMMIPHHQGAIAMSNVLLERGASPATRVLAQQIARAQAPEIELMRAYRIQLTGSAGPEEGVVPH